MYGARVGVAVRDVEPKGGCVMAGKKPYVAHYTPLHDWLHKHGFRCMWQTSTDRKPLSESNTAVEMWMAPTGEPVVLLVHPNGHGWEILTACGSRDIEDTFADAELRVGLRKARP